MSFPLISASQQSKQFKTPAHPFQGIEKYGLALDKFEVVEGSVVKNDVISTILSKFNFSQSTIHELVAASKGLINLRKIREGHKYTILSPDSCSAPQYFIYEPDDRKYVIFDLRNGVEGKMFEKKPETSVKTAHVAMKSSLWETILGNDLHPALADKLEDALKWQVDFHHMHEGDKFDMVYESEVIDGKEVGIGKLLSVKFENDNKAYYAFYFEGKGEKGYYDQDGRSNHRAFLKSPLRSSHVTSGFNPHRFHPILKQVRAHIGTDYAAPTGTPILAVSGGVLTDCNYNSTCGYNIRIKHDGTYQSQYLHMCRFASGIHKGSRVTQGQVIGYVGSTGLATGPHVCFRFYKNGRPVNHLNQKLPTSKQMPRNALVEFRRQRDYLMAGMDGTLSGACDLATLQNVPEGQYVKP
ncbi:MAG: peptidoglycan DD-metalloendopeptidase family protein [Saprospiraceae bacterium]